MYLQVAFGLWFISYIGSFLNFLTLIYIGELFSVLCVIILHSKHYLIPDLMVYLDLIAGVLLSLSVPFLYDTFQAQVDEKLIVVHKYMSTVFKKVDLILQNIPMSQNKQKKTE